MRKFTIFSLILSVIILVMVAEVVINDYLPKFQESAQAGFEYVLPGTEDLSNGTQANILGLADEDLNNLVENPEMVFGEDLFLPAEDSAIDNFLESNNELEVESFNLSDLEDNNSLPTVSDSGNFDIGFGDGFENTSPESVESGDDPMDIDFENPSFVVNSPNVYLRDEQIKSAGFTTAYISDDQHNGYLFKTVYVGDLNDIEISKKVIRDTSKMFAKVYIFTATGNSNIDQLYSVIKLRSAEGLQVETNETNSYGLSSFYMNDNSRLNVAFLVVKFQNVLFAFSYPKEYHSQVNNLIKLIDFEF